MRDARSSRLRALVVVAPILAVHAAADPAAAQGRQALPAAAQGRQALPAVGDTVDGVLVRGGTIVRRTGPDDRVDLLLKRHERFLVLVAVARDAEYSATDTLEVSGLYLHATSPFDGTIDTIPSLRPFALSIANWVVREGSSPGSLARWRVGPYEVRRVEPLENHPPGPVDERVGCYAIERGEWSNPKVPYWPSVPWVPDDLRLHWQYHWQSGRPPWLVATDRAGAVEGERTTTYWWRPLPGDSLHVGLGSPFVHTVFDGVRDGRDYVGELAIRTHSMA